jgi:hypothetical protein
MDLEYKNERQNFKTFRWKFYDFRVKKDFLNKIHKVQITKEKTDKFNYIKV